MTNHVIFDDIVTYLRNTGWEFRIIGSNALTSNVRGGKGVYLLVIAFDMDRDLIRIAAQLHDRIPHERSNDMLRLTAHINWRRDAAACDYDPMSGIVRFRAALPVDGVGFNQAQFSSILAAVFSIAEESMPGIEGLRTGRLSLDAAMEVSTLGKSDID